MNRIKTRLEKSASSGMSSELKKLCVINILNFNGVELNDLTAEDVVEYLEQNNQLTFENIEDLVKQWIEDTRTNYPENLK